MIDYNRTDSCRNCGESLDVLTNCMVCEQPSQFQCSNCSHFVDDPIHTHCEIVDEGL